MDFFNSLLIGWSRMGVFNRIFSGPAAEGGPPYQLMVEPMRSDPGDPARKTHHQRRKRLDGEPTLPG